MNGKHQPTDYTTLQSELETQYGPAVAQDIVDKIRQTKTVTQEPDYLDVKMLSDIAHDMRAQARMSITALRSWRKESRHIPHHNLVDLRDRHLLRNCQDAIALYRETNRSFFALYRKAMIVASRKNPPGWQPGSAANNNRVY